MNSEKERFFKNWNLKIIFCTRCILYMHVMNDIAEEFVKKRDGCRKGGNWWMVIYAKTLRVKRVKWGKSRCINVCKMCDDRNSGKGDDELTKYVRTQF